MTTKDASVESQMATKDRSSKAHDNHESNHRFSTEAQDVYTTQSAMMTTKNYPQLLQENDLDEYWIERFRKAGTLTLKQQIECCDAVIEIWLKSNNPVTAESCAHISISLRTAKHGYLSLEVAEALLTLSRIYYLRGDEEQCLTTIMQAESIVEIFDEKECQISPSKQRTMSKRNHQVPKRFFTVACSEISFSDYLHPSSLDRNSAAANIAIERLFAA
jgi:hypothetical protein